jgi:aryl-alcohol dehydrogenase-like predicted oxidoreductase
VGVRSEQELHKIHKMEVLANGRLAVGEHAPGDTAAPAAALAQPWATIVLSGAATAGQPASNLRATQVGTDPVRWKYPAMPAAAYWRERSRLPWG